VSAGSPSDSCTDAGCCRRSHYQRTSALLAEAATERANHWSSVIRSVGIHSLVSLRLDGSLFETFLSCRFMNTYARKFRFSSGG
jgi:hypothetical protein